MGHLPKKWDNPFRNATSGHPDYTHARKHAHTRTHVHTYINTHQLELIQDNSSVPLLLKSANSSH
jgi:hypothetical protein